MNGEIIKSVKRPIESYAYFGELKEDKGLCAGCRRSAHRWDIISAGGRTDGPDNAYPGWVCAPIGY